MMFAVFGLAAWAATNAVSTTPPISGTLTGDLPGFAGLDLAFTATPSDATAQTAGQLVYTGQIDAQQPGLTGMLTIGTVDSGTLAERVPGLSWSPIDNGTGFFIDNGVTNEQETRYYSVVVQQTAPDVFSYSVNRTLIMQGATPDIAFVGTIAWDLSGVVTQNDREPVDMVAEFIAIDILGDWIASGTRADIVCSPTRAECKNDIKDICGPAGIVSWTYSCTTGIATPMVAGSCKITCKSSQ